MALLLSAGAVFLTLGVGLVGWRTHLLGFHQPGQSAASQRSFRLPFSLPCAVESNDADVFYSALRQSDEKTVVAMLSAHRMLMISKETPISIMPLRQVAAVSTRAKDAASDGNLCYVPSNIVATIESKADRN